LVSAVGLLGTTLLAQFQKWALSDSWLPCKLNLIFMFMLSVYINNNNIWICQFEIKALGEQPAHWIYTAITWNPTKNQRNVNQNLIKCQLLSYYN
jgi:hypothetical protein